MPADYARVEVHLPLELSRKLEQLKLEIYEETGKKVPKNSILVEIVRQYFLSSNRSCFSMKKE